MKNNRKKSSIDPLAIQVRQQSGSPQALYDAFRAANWGRFQNILEWSYPRYRTAKFFCGLNTKNTFQLAKWIYLPLESPSESLRWAAAMATFKADEIKKFNQFVVQSENNRGNFRQINEMSKTLLSDTMLSYAGLGAFLFSLSRQEGLESQRRWMEEELYVANTSMANALFYFKGIAAETDRDPVDIFNTMFAAFFVNIDDPEFCGMITHVVLNGPISLKHFHDISKFFANQPIVDQYELAANAVCSNVHFLRSDSDENLDLFWDVMLETGDWRAEGISQLDAEIDSDSVFLPLSNPNSILFLEDLLGTLKGPEFNDREFRTTLANEFFCIQNSPAAYLASSCYHIKSANSIEAYLQALARREIAQAYLSHSAPSKAGRRRASITFDVLTDELESATTQIEKREIFRLACLSGIRENRFRDVLLCLFDITSSDPDASTYFPTIAFFQVCGEDELVDASDDPRVPVAISRVQRDIQEDGSDLLFLSVEQYLMEHAVAKPSELDVDPDKHVEFLYEACSLECLRQSLEFDSKLEVEEERLALLNILSATQSERKTVYEQEAHIIVGRQTVEELLQRYGVGKIHCDEKAILNWAEEELAAKFIRLKDFIEAGLLPVTKDADVEFLSHISSGKEGAFTFRVPSSEALSIASSFITELANKYALDPRHGIDSYLSLGMRHGELEEHLRTPLSNRELLSSKDITAYARTTFWNGIFTPNIGSEIGEVIAGFSEKYDGILKDIKNERIQVKRNDKPAGIIDLRWQEHEILSFAPAFARAENIHDLLEEFSKNYWPVVEQKLKPAREIIRNEIGPLLHSLIDELENEVASRTGYERLGPFSDAITRAREDLDVAIKELASWHNVARSTDTEPIALTDIIAATEKIVARLYPRFRPDVEITGDTNVSLTSSLHVLIEVFKALFINVQEHSGIDNPKIVVDIDATVSDQLIVEFSSSCSDIEAGIYAAELANQRIQTGEYEAQLPKEGGSGLPKVARATVKEGRPNTVVSVDEERSLFCVQMSFSLLHI